MVSPKWLLRKIQFFFATILLFVLIGAFPLQVYATSWETSELMSSNAEASVTEGADGTYIVTIDRLWGQSQFNFLGNYSAYITTSADQGRTWTDVTQLVSDTGHGMPSKMSATSTANGTFIAVYRDDPYLMFASSSDALSWNSAALSDNTLYDTASLAVDSNGVYYVVAGGGWGESALTLFKSTNNGQSWTEKTIQAYSEEIGTYEIIDLKISGSTIIAAVMSNNFGNTILHFAKSSDSGETWSTVTVDSNSDSYNPIYTPISLVVDAVGNYLIAYPGVDDILKFAKSTDGGNSWSTSTITDTAYTAWCLSLDATSTNTYIVIAEDDEEYLFKKYSSTDLGQTWSTEDFVIGGQESVNVWGPNFAFDSDGNYLISYLDDDASLMKFSRGINDSSAPSITLNTYTTTSTSDQLHFTGSVVDSSSTITTVEYKLSTASTWTAATAADGSFNSSSESFSINTSGLSDGTYSYYVRATDSLGNVTSADSYSTITIVVDTTAPTSPEYSEEIGFLNITSPVVGVKKSTDATSGLSSYSFSLDEGKNRMFNVSGVPIAGNGTASYVWKDNATVKVEYLYENDSDASNDQIKVRFKELDNDPLTEGNHQWKVVVSDVAGNERAVTKDVSVDLTKPNFSWIYLDGVSGALQENITYTLSGSHRLPLLSGRVSDSYKGSERTNTNGSKDTFSKVASGPSSAILTYSRLNDGQDPNISTAYTKVTEIEQTITQVIDSSGVEKYAELSLKPRQALEDGYYKGVLLVRDAAGNASSLTFYLSINYEGVVVSDAVTTAAPIDELITTMKEVEKISVSSEEEKQEVAIYGRIVSIKVLDSSGKPLPGVKVELHSTPREAVTNAEGIAMFKNVEPGEHTIKIAYQKKQGEQKVVVEDDPAVKEYRYTIKLEKDPLEQSTQIWKWLTISMPLILGVLLLIVLYKHRMKNR